jgi:hypothetical protein
MKPKFKFCCKFEPEDSIQIGFFIVESPSFLIVGVQSRIPCVNAKTSVVGAYATSKPKMWPACWQGEEKKKKRKELKKVEGEKIMSIYIVGLQSLKVSVIIL